MRVLKVINNNVLTCLDSQNREAVVMGRGLGFHAKPGMDLDEHLAEKVFRMESQEQMTRLQNLIDRVPQGLLELCTRIVDYAGQILGRRLNQNIYLTLTDHVQFAMERCRQGVGLPNALLTEVRVFYPEEYTIGRYALEQIALHMGVTLPEDEAASIALHLVNAEYDRSMDATMRAAQVLLPIMEIIRGAENLSLAQGSLRFNELIVHLKFMAMEAFTSGSRNEEGCDRDLEDKIPAAWACARQICRYLSEQSGKPVSPGEEAYLAICIQRAQKPN